MGSPGLELCVGAVAVDDGDLLLVRRGRPPDQGHWSVPGGRVEPGETLVEAVVRELLEETGLEGVCGPLVGWVERISTDHHFVILDFMVTLLERRDPVAGTDAAEVRWVPLEDVWEMDLVDGLGEFLADNGIVPAVGGPPAE